MSGAFDLVRIGAAALLMIAPIAAGATIQRTFVSSNGNDANACSLAQPCRGFAAAVANTSPGGEVIVLDSAGYGAVTITKSIMIVAPAGIYAGVTVFIGNGITVNGAGISVKLRGLSINGQGGVNGVAFVQGKSLAIEDCDISGMQYSGISAIAPNSSVAVRNSALHDNAGYGFVASDTVIATLDSVHSFSNDLGVGAGSGSRVTVSESTIASNTIGAVSITDNLPAHLFVTRSTLSGNGSAFVAQADAGHNASLVSDANSIAFHSITAFLFDNMGGSEVIYTFGNNSAGYFGSAVSGGTLTPLPPM